MDLENKTVLIVGCLLLLIAITSLLLNVAERKETVSFDCSQSIKCENDCNNFYSYDVINNHSLECGYKCLAPLNCKEKQK